MRGRRALIGFIALAPLVPILISLGHELLRPVPWGPAGGDYAVLEIQLRAASEFKHWLGPYSRFGWSHPGPFYYYVLSPLYWLTSGSSTSLYLSATLITLGAAIATTVMFYRERRELEDRLVFALAFGAAAFYLWARKLPADPWNPAVTVLPFAAFFMACAQVASSRIELLPLSVLLHAFISQTHISYLPCATALLAAALALCSWRRRSTGTPEQGKLYGSIAISVLIVGLAWLPALIAELGPGRSNIGVLLRHFAGAEVSANSIQFALTYGSARLHAPLLHVLGASADNGGLLAPMLSATQLVLLGVSIAVARARKDAFVWCSGVLAAVAIIACLESCRHIGKVSAHQGYLTLWFAFAGMFGWLTVGLALLPVVSSLSPKRWPRLSFIALASAVLGGLALVDSRSVWSRYQRMPERSALGRQQIEAATGRVEWLLRQAPAGYVLSTGEGRPWEFLAGLVLGLQKRGLAPVLEERWRFMFGGGVEYAGHGAKAGSLSVARRLSHSARLIATFGSNAFLYLEAPAPRVTARMAVEASGAQGEPGWVVDGRAPAAGAPWDSYGALRLGSEASSVTLQLPGLRLAGLDVVLDGNDTYLLEASEDGRSFQRVGEISPLPAPGLHRRHVPLPDGGPWRSLRLSPLSGDGMYAVAEVSLDAASWGVNALEARGNDGDPRLTADGKTPRQGSRWATRGTVRLRDSASFITFALPATRGQEARIDGLRISADGNDEYEVSGSYDGLNFRPIGILPSLRKGGLRIRDFYFNDARAWSAVRVAPGKGDGRFSIAEVSPIVAAGRLIDFNAGGAELESGSVGPRAAAAPSGLVASEREPVRVRVPLVSGAGYLLELVLDAPRQPPPRIGVSLNGEGVKDIELVAGRFSYFVDLPGRLVRAENVFEFETSSAPFQDRAQVRVDALSLTPLEGTARQSAANACMPDCR